MNFKNKVVVITGASSGIGEAAAEKFAKKGANIVLVARKKEKLDQVEKKLSKHSVKILVQVCDVSDKEQVKQMSEKSSKPIIASMGGMAASGGYYIALGADTIIANPGTATGSIGVIMTYPIIHELMNKLGISQETIKSTSYKDAGSIFRALTDNERKYFQNLIDDLHKQFVTTVSLERDIAFIQAEKLSNGEVYSGNQALEKGLIDMLGTLEDAILIASQKTGLQGKPSIIYPPEEKKGLLTTLFGNILQPASISNLNLYPQIEYKIK